MKKRLIAALLLSLSSLTLVSCNPIPTAPGSGNPTGNPNGPIILAMISRGTINGTSSVVCQVSITSAQYTPVPGCAVTLVAPGSTVVLGENVTGYFSDSSGSWPYTPGQTYTVNLQVNGTNYSGNLQVPGGVTVPNSGTPASWTHEGTVDTVAVLESSPNAGNTYSSYPGTTNASSPINLSSAYPDVPGNYAVQVNVIKVKTSAFGAGAHPAASITGSDQFMKSITK